jgi:excisionase family DNA binding protein
MSRKCVAHSKALAESVASLPEMMVESVHRLDRPADAGERSPVLFYENLKWLTSREAVVYLRLPSLGALRNLVYRRKIPFVRLGRRLRFNREALDRFLESSLTERRIA